MQRHRIDQHRHAVAHDDDVVLGLVALDVELVLKAGAAAALDADAQHRACRLGLEDLADPPGGAVGDWMSLIDRRSSRRVPPPLPDASHLIVKCAGAQGQLRQRGHQHGGRSRSRARAYASDPAAKPRPAAAGAAESPTRNVFRRDCDRIIHSAAFRRLAHKTQVFVFHEGDHFRTRLTHTLEVTQIARSLARALGLDEDLAEALGARPRSRPSAVRPCRRARARPLPRRHSAASTTTRRRLVSSRALERRYADFDGLNLTWETLEGLVKHNGPLTDRDGAPVGALSRARRAAGHRRDSAQRTTSSSGATPAPRRKPPPSPTISPTTPTTSTTGCAPRCSRSTISRGAAARESCADRRGSIRGSTAPAGARSWSAV